MKKNKEFFSWGNIIPWERTCRIMKVLLILLTTTLVSFATGSYSQSKNLNFRLEQVNLIEVFEQIEKQSDMKVAYDISCINVHQKVTILADDATVENVIKKVLENTDLSYRILNHYIIISKNENNGTVQQKSISGKVTDSSGSPVPGVSVVVKGTTIGTITDATGKYTLPNIPEKSVLQFSFVGMKLQEIMIGNNSTIDVSLVEDAIGIEEVVAIGYGVQKKVNLTGSVQAVSSEQLESRPVTNISNALSGNLSGVSVVKSSGAPGAGSNITIRGLGSFGSSSPLVLVDGLETNIDDVLPSDVESISVLKDAASASIYGSRAANGVILITTKRGKASPFKVSYDFYIGKQKAVNLPNYVGAVEYMKYENEARANVGQPASFSTELINQWQNSPDRDAFPNTNWVQEAITGSGNQQSHALSMSGGTEDSKYFISFGYQNQAGIISNNEFKKYSIRFNADTKLYKKLSLKTSVMSFSNDYTDPGFGDVWGQVLRIPAIYPARFSNGEYGNWAGINPIANLEKANLNKDKSYFSMGNFALNYDILPGLKVELTPGYKIYSTNSKDHKMELTTYDYIPTTKTIEPGVVINTPTSVSQSNSTVVDLTLQSLITYTKKIGEHSIGGLFGYSQESWKEENFQAFRDNFPTILLDNLNVGSPENQRNSGYSNEWALQSYFGRLNYNFKEKYLFEANVRYDGSSRFAEDKRWGIFPSFSAGWRLSEEKFIKDLTFIDNLKLRASWGQLGNQDAVNRLGYYPFASTYSPTENYVFGGAVTQGAALSGLANKDVTWETVETTDFGLDADLLNGKVGIVFDYFFRKTNDGLLDFPVATTTGYISANSYGPWSSVSRSTIPMNGARVQNQGFEINVNYKDNIGKLKYQVGLNLTHLKNKVTDLRGLGPIIQGGSVLMEGEPMNSFYGYKSDGLFQLSDDLTQYATQDANTSYGDIKYKDITPDGVIDSKDRVIIGNPNPDFIFGFNINLNYKGFDFTALLQGIGKVDGYRSGWGVWAFSNGGSVRDILTDRWTPVNPNAAYPRFTYDKYFNYETSDFWIQSAAYARLKNAQIGYSLSKGLLNRINIEKVRIYITGENLFTISNFDKGYDPETQIYGYPQLRSYNVGLNVTF